MEDSVLKKCTPAKFISFAIGFFGLQFAWQMRIILSGPVTEELGASPFIFGLIWLFFRWLVFIYAYVRVCV